MLDLQDINQPQQHLMTDCELSNNHNMLLDPVE